MILGQLLQSLTSVSPYPWAIRKNTSHPPPNPKMDSQVWVSPLFV